MRIVADYHTHTIYSHGKGTIEENVKEAINKGLEEIAISDHGPGHLFFGIKRYKLKEMREEIDRLNKVYPQIKVLLALEANFMSEDGSIDVYDEMFDMLDLILCGYHFGSTPKHLFKDLAMHTNARLSSLSKKSYEKSKKINTEMLINAMNKYNINIITHPGAKGPIDVYEVAKVAASKNVALEVNAKHGHLTVDEIKIALKTDVKFVIGSDAHEVNRVGDFIKGIERCKAAGVPVNRIINARN